MPGIRRVVSSSLLCLLIAVPGSSQRIIRLDGSAPPARVLIPVPKPPVSTDILRLTFSPDGHYILAQDRRWITVLTVEPFEILFRAAAEDADNLAQFSPDSREVVFVRSPRGRNTHQLVVRETPRLERWSIANRYRIESVEVPARISRGCGTEQLSPDGRIKACADTSGTFRLIDLLSGSTIFEKKDFGKKFQAVETRWDGYSESGYPVSAGQSGDVSSATFSFSPDGRYILAMPDEARGHAVAFDLRENRELKLGGALGKLRSHGQWLTARYAFVAPDKLIVSKVAFVTGRAKILSFPSGKVLSKPLIPRGRVRPTMDPGFVLIESFGDFPQLGRAAAVELRTGQVIVSDGALDVYGRHIVTFQSAGTLALHERGKGLKAVVRLGPS